MKTLSKMRQNFDKAARKDLRRRIWQHRWMYLFVLPAIIWYIVFHYVPLYGITLAFRDYRFDLGIFRSPWAGMKYFKQFFNYFEFWTLIKNTLSISALKFVIGFPFPIILALSLNEIKNTKFKRVIQTVTYLPHFLSWVIVLAFFNTMFSPNGGVVNQLLEKFLGIEPIYFLGEPRYFRTIIVATHVWKGIGWSSIIYLAAITSVDQQMYEAAHLDGAGRFKCMWYITLPTIVPTIGVLLLMNITSLINAGFDQVYLFQTPGTLGVSEVLNTYTVKTGIQQGMFSYATAIGLFQSVVALILMLVSNFLSKRTSGISLW